MDTITILKKKGRVAYNSADYSEACRYYTEALSLLGQKFYADQNEGVKVNVFTRDSHEESCLYSKRSAALLKMGQYFYAYEDAKQITNITPEWFKGYLRKANVELECGLFEKSLKNYQLSLRYLDQVDKEEPRKQYDKHIQQTIKHVLYMMQREKIFDYQIPWIGAAFGLVVGMAIVTWDYVSFHNRSYISHPILKLSLIGFVSFIFFYLAGLHRKYTCKQKEQLLLPPYSEL